MKKHLLLSTLLMLFFAGCACACTKKSHTGTSPDDPGNNKPITGEYNEEMAFNMATYNILCCGTGNHAWSICKSRVEQRLRDHEIDIFGIQEGTPSQITDLKAMFPEFTFYGIGREPGGVGEHVDVVWRTERFNRLDGGQFWYSDTPNVPSNGWDGGFYRICTWVKMKDKRSEKEFYLFNSHMALELEGRVKSSELLLSKVAEIAGDTPAYCMGDFNSGPVESPILAMRAKMDDPLTAADQRVGNTTGTFNALNENYPVPPPDKRIDFIFMTKGVKAFLYQCIDDDLTKRAYASDHFPVMIRTVPSAN